MNFSNEILKSIFQAEDISIRSGALHDRGRVLRWAGSQRFPTKIDSLGGKKKSQTRGFWCQTWQENLTTFNFYSSRVRRKCECACVRQRFTRRCERSHSGLSPRRQYAFGLYATGRNWKMIMNQINTMSEVLMRHCVHSSSADATVKPVWTVCGRQEQLQVQTRFSMNLNSLISYLHTGAVLVVTGEVYFQTVSSHTRRSQINQAREYRRWSRRRKLVTSLLKQNYIINPLSLCFRV